MEISMLMSKPEWRWLPQVPEDKSTLFCSTDISWAPALCLALLWVLGQQRQIRVTALVVLTALEDMPTWKYITMWLNSSSASSTCNIGGRVGGRREPWKRKPSSGSPRNA